MHTLTRIEVARRLGKSIATVRRLENRVLFPERDKRGVLRFDELEVERARCDPAALKAYSQSRWLEEKVREATRTRHDTRAGSGHAKSERGESEHAGRLADDLQAMLYKLFLRFGLAQLRTSGLDADLLTRAFDAVQRLRAMRLP